MCDVCISVQPMEGAVTSYSCQLYCSCKYRRESWSNDNRSCNRENVLHCHRCGSRCCCCCCCWLITAASGCGPRYQSDPAAASDNWQSGSQRLPALCPALSMHTGCTTVLLVERTVVDIVCSDVASSHQSQQSREAVCDPIDVGICRSQAHTRQGKRAVAMTKTVLD
jgi:hypothetical protein